MADRVNVKIENVDGLLAKLTKLTRITPDVVRARVKKGLVAIEGNAKRRCPVRFGPLRNSISHETDSDGLGGRAGTNKEYGPPVEFGAAPHTIVPKRARALRFTVGGNVIFARVVHHPGNRAQPFMLPAFEEEYPIFLRGLAADLEGAARIVASE